MTAADYETHTEAVASRILELLDANPDHRMLILTSALMVANYEGREMLYRAEMAFRAKAALANVKSS